MPFDSEVMFQRTLEDYIHNLSRAARLVSYLDPDGQDTDITAREILHLMSSKKNISDEEILSKLLFSPPEFPSFEIIRPNSLT